MIVCLHKDFCAKLFLGFGQFHLHRWGKKAQGHVSFHQAEKKIDESQFSFHAFSLKKKKHNICCE